MKKPIFENEKECMEFMEAITGQCGSIETNCATNCLRCKIGIAKKRGYIKQSELEKAEKIYEEYRENHPLYVYACDYIRELKKEIEKLNTRDY